MTGDAATELLREALRRTLRRRIGARSISCTEDLLPVEEAECRRRAAEAEQRGYERGRRDFQFAPEGDNHHNAAMCPYCSPARADAIEGRP